MKTKGLRVNQIIKRVSDGKLLKIICVKPKHFIYVVSADNYDFNAGLPYRINYRELNINGFYERVEENEEN